MKIPKQIKDVIDRQELHILSTSSKDGIPNIIYLKFLKVYNDEQILIANNKFHKTQKNIVENPRISFVVLDKDNKRSYQLKGNVEIHEGDNVHEDAEKWINSVKPGATPPRSGVILNVEEIYCGSEKVLEH